jgi:hypothetical protein
MSGLEDIYIKDDDSCYVKMFIYLPFMLYINYSFIDHVVMGINVTLLSLFAKHDIHLKATCCLTNVSYLSLMNPLLYLLSTICAHSCYFPTPQDGQPIKIRKRITMMSIRLDVNQLTSLCWSFRERVIFSCYIYC